MTTLLEAIAAEPGARLPGTRRLANRRRAAAEGVAVPAALDAEIRALAGRVD
jgi:(2R)-3-sulfolactate dehydrogenase (NADP+)